MLVPNAPLFFGGLLLGYHRETIQRWWQRFPLRDGVDLAVVVTTVGLAVLHARGWQELTWLGDALTAGNPEEPLWVRESELPIGPLLGVMLFMRAGWILGAIGGAVHVRRHVLAWLRADVPTRAWVRRHGAAVAVAALGAGMLAAGVGPTGQAGDWGAVDHHDEAEETEDGEIGELGDDAFDEDTEDE